MQTAYIYKWIHIPTGKWYIGSKSNKDANPLTHEKYICSSKIVKPMIKENRDDWCYEIIETGNPSIIRKRETEILKQLDAKNDPMSYNRSNACWDPGNRLGRKESIETKTKKSKARKGELNPNYGKLGTNSPNYGKTKSNEAREKISSKLKSYNKNRPKEHNENISKSLKGNIKLSKKMQGKNNPMFGKPASAFNKEMSKIKNSGSNNPMCKPENQRICEHCNKLIAKNHYTMYHGSNCKLKTKE